MKPPVHQAMLMAAGLGTRLRPFTERCPKALLPLMNVPIAQFAVDALVHAGVDKIVANVHHLATQTSEGLRVLDLQCAALELSDERSGLLGSGGGVRQALPRFGHEPFFYFNADVITGIDLGRLARYHARLRVQWGVKVTLAICPQAPSNAAYSEVFLDSATGLITGLGKAVPAKPYFMSVAVIEPDAFDRAPAEGEFGLVEEVFKPAIAEGKAGAYLVEDPVERLWFDIGSPELWLETHLELIRLLEKGSVPALWRRRIEAECTRVSDQLWVSRPSLPLTPSISRTGWAAPAFLDLAPGAIPPREFGPAAVLYQSRNISLGPVKG